MAELSGAVRASLEAYTTATLRERCHAPNGYLRDNLQADWLAGYEAARAELRVPAVEATAADHLREAAALGPTAGPDWRRQVIALYEALPKCHRSVWSGTSRCERASTHARADSNTHDEYSCGAHASPGSWRTPWADAVESAEAAPRGESVATSSPPAGSSSELADVVRSALVPGAATASAALDELRLRNETQRVYFDELLALVGLKESSLDKLVERVRGLTERRPDLASVMSEAARLAGGWVSLMAQAGGGFEADESGSYPRTSPDAHEALAALLDGLTDEEDVPIEGLNKLVARLRAPASTEADEVARLERELATLRGLLEQAQKAALTAQEQRKAGPPAPPPPTADALLLARQGVRVLPQASHGRAAILVRLGERTAEIGCRSDQEAEVEARQLREDLARLLDGALQRVALGTHVPAAAAGLDLGAKGDVTVNQTIIAIAHAPDATPEQVAQEVRRALTHELNRLGLEMGLPEPATVHDVATGKAEVADTLASPALRAVYQELEAGVGRRLDAFERCVVLVKAVNEAFALGQKNPDEPLIESLLAHTRFDSEMTGLGRARAEVDFLADGVISSLDRRPPVRAGFAVLGSAPRVALTRLEGRWVASCAQATGAPADSQVAALRSLVTELARRSREDLADRQQRLDQLEQLAAGKGG